VSLLFTFGQAIVASCIAVGLGAALKWLFRLLWPVMVLDDTPTCSVCNRTIIWPMDEPVPVGVKCIECKTLWWKQVCGVTVAVSVAILIACAFYTFLW